MAKQIINAGTTNNDKTGDTLRAGALKIKSNFDEIYNALANDGSTISGGNLLKTGDYQDLRNKPVLSNVAISGNFYDLNTRPDLGIFVGEPPNSQGSQGHVAGNLAFSNNNFYVCLADYEQQASSNGLVVTSANGYDLEISWVNSIQDVINQFNAGKAVSINPGSDGNWRTVTAISRNQTTGRANVTYSGNQFGATSGITIRVDQPIIWQSIPWTPDYGHVFPGLGGGLSQLSNGTAVFSLGSDGVLQLPINGDIKDSNGNSVLGNSSGNITFPITQNDYNSPMLLAATSDDTNWAFGFFNNNGGSQFYTQASFFGSGSADRAFRILDNNNNNQWTFDGEGNLVLPSGGDIKRDGVSVLSNGSNSASGVMSIGTYNGDWHPSANPQVYNVADFGEPNIFVMSQNGANADLLVNLPANPTNGKQFTIKFTGVGNPTYHMIVAVDGGGMIDNQSGAMIDIIKDNGFLNVVWDAGWNTYWIIGKDLA